MVTQRLNPAHATSPCLTGGSFGCDSAFRHRDCLSGLPQLVLITVRGQANEEESKKLEEYLYKGWRF